MFTVGTDRPSALGSWVLERVASLRLDWPTIAFLRTEVHRGGLEMLVQVGGNAAGDLQTVTLSRAVERELDVAARRGGWVRQGLWEGVEILRETE